MKLHLKTRDVCWLASAGALLLVACSVDTSGIVFVPDSEYSSGGNPEGGIAGVNIGGVVNISGFFNGGSKGKAGDGAGGSDAGGSDTGGMPPGGNDAGGMPPGGNNAGGNTGNCSVLAANPAEPLIDDLEDGNPGILLHGGRDGGWYSYNDNSGGTQMPPVMTMPMPQMGGAAMTKLAMHLSGKGFKVFGAALGFSFRAPMMGPPCPYDVSPQTGIRFYFKATITSDSMMPGAKLFRVQMATQETQTVMQGGNCTGMCGDHFGVNLDKIPAEWTEIEVPFATLTQEGFGNKVALNLAHATSVEFVGGPNTTFDFWVDQITFY